MGSIFSWGRVRENRIPTCDDFSELAKSFLGALRVSNYVRAASVYGSVARGDHTPRSDLDLLVLCDDRGLPKAMQILLELRRQADERNVVLSSHILSLKDVRAGRTRFGASYRSTFTHLADVPTTFGDPHLYLPDSVRMKPEVRVKLKSAAENFEARREDFLRVPNTLTSRSLDAWLECDLKKNRRLLHIYMVMARWMLLYEHGEFPNDSKASVVETFLQHSGFAHLYDSFIALRQIDLAYDDILARARDGCVRRELYVARVVKFVTEAFTHGRDLIAGALNHCGLRTSAKQRGEIRRVAA